MSHESEVTSNKGYLVVTVANLGGRRKRTEIQERLMLEILSFRTGLLMFQEWQEENTLIPREPCVWDKAEYLATALNAALGSIERHAYFEVKGKGYEKNSNRTDILVSRIRLEPSRAGLTELLAINLHFQHRMANNKVPGNWQARQDVYEHIARVVRDAPPNVPTILGGDFNSQHWRALDILRLDHQLEAVPLVLPFGTDEYWRETDVVGDNWPDCLCLYWLGAMHKLPPRIKGCFFEDFDPQRVLLGHGAHSPIGVYLGGNQSVRTREARRAKRLRRAAKAANPPQE